MGATTLTAFDPDIQNTGLIKTFKAASAILSGAVVAYADAGASRTVAPATSSLGTPVGVALASQATAGEPVPVAMNGCVVKVMLDTDNGTLDAGHWVKVSTVAGCVNEWDPAIGGHAATTDTGAWPIGYALDDIAAGAAGTGGTGYILVNVCPLFTASS